MGNDLFRVPVGQDCKECIPVCNFRNRRFAWSSYVYPINNPWIITGARLAKQHPTSFTYLHEKISITWEKIKLIECRKLLQRRLEGYIRCT